MNNWVIDSRKFMRGDEVKVLMETCRSRAGTAAKKGRKQAIKDYMLIHLAMSSGLRVAEIADLRIRDLGIDYGQNSLLVENGKGGKRRIVIIDRKLKEHLIEFIEFKANVGEDVSDMAYLFVSERSDQYSTRGLQRRFKACLTYAGINPKKYSIHSTRHTFCTELLRVSKNLRLVQKQAGHSSPFVTTAYADIVSDEMEQAVNQMYL